VDRGCRVILGTAGHIDHGKTTLVRALTGVDTDRLPEEKRRGITIELGFAPLVIDGVGTIGVVDVPGHEAFVRTMVAGATGIDLALVVIAADEGVMPQTREHLAILGLLGVRRGIIALTKSDLVDEDWLALVVDDARQATASNFPDAEVLATSAQTGAGISELREAIGRIARGLRARSSDDLFRLPVDRAFSIKGTGTVVTGTVWSGRLAKEQTVRVLPGDRGARVRGIQGHGTQLDLALPGARAAIALATLTVDDVPRGSSLVTDPLWRTTTSALADVSLVEGVDVEIRPRTWFRFHVGTSEVGVRVVTRAPTANAPFGARLMFDAPVLLRAGDRFVVRTSAPLNTIAGGVIVDPYAPKRARAWPAGLSAPERLIRLVEESGSDGLETATLPVRLGDSPADCAEMVGKSSEAIIATQGRLFPLAALSDLKSALLAATKAFHDANSLDVGVAIQTLRAGSRWHPEATQRAIDELIQSGALANHGGVIALPDWTPTPTNSQQAVIDQVLTRLNAAGPAPPSVAELAMEIGREVSAELRFLERGGGIVQVESDRYFTADQLKQVLERIRGVMAGGGEKTPAELRESLDLSRKFLIPILEYCDRMGLTARGVNGRVWRRS
jgi:selenocysteine-specific elongation factor